MMKEWPIVFCWWTNNIESCIKTLNSHLHFLLLHFLTSKCLFTQHTEPLMFRVADKVSVHTCIIKQVSLFEDRSSGNVKLQELQ